MRENDLIGWAYIKGSLGLNGPIWKSYDIIILLYSQIKETHVKEKRKGHDDGTLVNTNKKNRCVYYIVIIERVGDLERTADTSRPLGENHTCKFPFFVIPKTGKKQSKEKGNRSI